MRCLKHGGVVWIAISVLLVAHEPAYSEVTAEQVREAIERGTDYLVSRQKADGTWESEIHGHDVGIASLAMLALAESGKTAKHPTVDRTLKYLRSIRPPDETYDLSLMIMALAALENGKQDKALIQRLAAKLEGGQITVGQSAGLWDYSVNANTIGLGGDRSNGEFAALGLWAGARGGAKVNRETWRRVDRHWKKSQENDGGWSYRGAGSTGSMTTAGIAALLISRDMLRGEDERLPDGEPACCTKTQETEGIQRGLDWIGRFFTAQRNPGSGNWLFYYLYGVERAGRLSGQRFFRNKDWFRQGAEVLMQNQDRQTGAFASPRNAYPSPVVTTSMALLFLSKGMAPVLINKAKFGERGRDGAVIGDDWNKHPHDAQSLVEFISGRPKWSRLVTWQVADTFEIAKNGSVDDLLQAPILYLSGEDGYRFSDAEVQLLREYVKRGGFILAVNCCDGEGFKARFQDLVTRLFPGKLKPLPAGHAIFHSEYDLKDAGVELQGVDVGRRTAIVYSPDDLSCLWNKWMRQPPPKRPAKLNEMIEKKIAVGVNIAAYATGRKLDDKLEVDTDE